MRPNLAAAVTSILLFSIPSLALAENERPEAIPVKVRKPLQMRQNARVSASGSVDSQDTSNVGFQVPGKVAKVLVEEGATVKRGQVLAELDPADYRMADEAAVAQAAAARATRAKAMAGPRAQEVELAKIQFDRAEDEYKRYKLLYERKSLPPVDFKKAEAAYLAAKQQYDMAREGTRKEDKNAAVASVDQAEAAERIAKKRLTDTTLLAPIGGTIARRNVNPGETVAAGMPLFTILNLSVAKVKVGVPESDIDLVHPGQKATVTVPALGDRAFEGIVDLVGSAAEPTSRTFTVKIAIPNGQRALKAGMIAEARIQSDRMVDVITVPAEAIVRDPQGATLAYVYFAQQKRVYARRVQVGGVYGREVAIQSGLTASDDVVIAGQNRVREGSVVEAK